jgi:Flp pilus assembly protein TadG
MAMFIRLALFRNITRRVNACGGGNSAVEFALAGPILVLLGIGAFDYGSAYVEGVRLNGAARAGAQQSLYDSNTWKDTDQAEQTALEEYVGHALTPDQIAAMPVSATATAFCACPAGATLACTAACPDGSSPGQFVRVDMTGTVPLTLPYPWANSDEMTVGGRAVVRVR